MYYLYNFLLSFMLSNVNHAWKPELYAFHPKIHMLGNHGFMGKIHAEIAPLTTKLIDNIAHNGVNIRSKIIEDYGYNNSVLDLCCGTGFSTPPHDENYYHLGIDSSKEMINKANNLWSNKNFQVGNAETFYTNSPFDIVTIYYALHEIPQEHRHIIINNAIKNARKKVIIVDICPDYNPSCLMLKGEPYIEEYLKNIDQDLKYFEKKSIIEGRVTQWTYLL